MITCLAAAKVNLDLRVTGRRDNGYHELDSLVVFPSIGDVLTFEPAPELTLLVDGPQAGSLRDVPPEKNLVLQAAERLRRHANLRSGASIRLTKNLPVAAGLGGGSADAAACLLGLKKLWKLEVDRAALLRIGLELGADVPACLTASPCYLTGIGEGIERVENLPTLWMVLVNPGIALSTPRVFSEFAERFSAPRTALQTAGVSGTNDRAALLTALFSSVNDLEGPAISLVPQIAECLGALRATSGCLLARMSGSGASCFGLFASPEEAAASAHSIKTAHSDWWTADGKMT